MSKIKVNRLENTSTANGGIDIDSSGHVQIEGQQFPTEGYSAPNLIHNPTMVWSNRTFSGGLSKAGVKAVDRWNMGCDVDGEALQSRLTLGSGDQPYNDDKVRFAFRNTNNAANQTGAGKFFYQSQSIDGHTIRKCGWNFTDPNSYITLSFWAKSSVTQTFTGYFLATDSNLIYPYEFDLTAGQWKLVEVSVPGNAGIDFISSSAERFRVHINQFWGTDFTDNSVTYNSWANYSTGATRVQDMETTWASTANATFDITAVKLEVGSKRTKFTHPDPVAEYNLMQHYCRLIADGEHFPVGTGSYYQADDIYMTINLGQRMRATPTAYIEPGTNTYDAFRRGASDSMDSPILSNNARPWCVEFKFSGNVGGTVGDACFIRTDHTDCLIYLECDIS
jgi:hypothetical protein